MKNILNIIVESLRNRNIIDEQATDIYRYGLEIFVSSLIQVLSIIVISIFSDNFLETCVFFSSFIPLRMYGGGYHAKTKLRCYIVSISVYIVFTIATNVIPNIIYNVIIVFEVIFSMVIVYLFAPIVHINKHMCSIETQNYRKVALCICIFESFCCLSLNFLLNNQVYIFSIALGQLAATISMLAACIKNLLNEKAFKLFKHKC